MRKVIKIVARLRRGALLESCSEKFGKIQGNTSDEILFVGIVLVSELLEKLTQKLVSGQLFL